MTNTVVIGSHLCADGTGPRLAIVEYRLSPGQSISLPAPNGYNFRVFQDEGGPTTITFYSGDVVARAVWFSKYSVCEIALSNITRIDITSPDSSVAGKIWFSVPDDECDVPAFVGVPTIFGYPVVVDESLKSAPLRFGTFKEYMG